MNQLVHTDFQIAHEGATHINQALSKLGRQAKKARGAKGLAGLLVTGGVSAAIVVANQIVSAWTDGHLLLAWIAMWVVVFALLAVFSEAIRSWPAALQQRYAAWEANAALRAANARTWDAALADPRLMAELQCARRRADEHAAANGAALPFWPFDGMPAHRQAPRKWA